MCDIGFYRFCLIGFLFFNLQVFGSIPQINDEEELARILAKKKAGMYIKLNCFIKS